jgi:hypothetical protein
LLGQALRVEHQIDPVEREYWIAWMAKGASLRRI